MASLEDKIREIEEEIHSTKYNKATQHHIGKLKAKLARMRDEKVKRSKGPAGSGFHVRKSGNATIALIGLPSVGKSTLLNQLTDADSEVGAYQFTTLSVIPGVMEYRGAKIQVLDMPGIIKGAAHGKGRGREVISAARSSDLILMILDVFDTNIELLERELRDAGIRLNVTSPDVVLYKKDRGGLEISSTVKLTKMDEELISEMAREYGIVNAGIVLREDVDADRFMDALTGNRVFTKALVVLNKVDLAEPDILEAARKKLKAWQTIEISAKSGQGMEELKEGIFNTLEFMRIYMKPPGQKPDLDEPLVIKSDSTVEDVCWTLHRDFKDRFRFAHVWGKSAKFPGQMVGLSHELKDGDILSIVIVKQ